MKLHTVNAAQGLYVIESGSGFSCYGFAVLDRKARAIRAWLEKETGAHCLDAIPEETGTPEHFAACAGFMRAGAVYAKETGRRCTADLVPELCGLEGRRVECEIYGERVRFNVGRSLGWMPVHLRLHNRASRGGEALSPDSVKLLRVIS